MNAILLLCALAGADVSVRVVKDIPYLPSAQYADNKDTLDLYVPEGKPGMPVITALIVYADGDEPWRRQQNVEMAQALEATGSGRVEIVQIANRTHMSILRKLPEDGDPAAARVVEFVRAVSGATASPR